jgi:hypothetical protein
MRRDGTGEMRARVQARLRAEGQAPDVEAAARGIRHAAENRIDKVNDMLDRAEAKLSADVIASAEAKLKVAAELLVKGDAALAAGNASEAFRTYVNAEIEAEQAKRLIVANLELGVKAEVSAQASVDDEKAEEEGEEGDDADEDGDDEDDKDRGASGSADVDVDVDVRTPAGSIQGSINANGGVNLR